MSEQYPGGFINKTAPTLNPALGNAAPGVWNMTQVQQARKAGTWPAYDPYFKNVTMMLHGDGTNGGQNNTFLDSSTNNFTITRNGNATQGTFTPYGSNWSNYFDGSSFETVAGSTNLAFGTGDFTIECWVNFNSVSGGNWLDMRPASTNGAYPNLYVSSGTLAYYVSSADRITGGTVTTGTWYHIALCRSGTSTKLFLNGTQVGSTYTDSNNYACGTNRPMIGGNGFSGSANLSAYISNFRFVKGTALYTTAFTPPTTPLTAITNTSLLTCQSNRFIDNSASPYTITTSGSPSVQRFSPFSPSSAYSTSVIGGSGYFDGNGDYLTIPANTVFRQDQGDWTLEGWFYVTSFATNCCFFSMGAMTSIDNFTAYTTTAGKVGYEAGTGGWAATANYETASGAISLNSWNHIAWVRSSGSLFIYVNGTRVLNQASAAFGVNSNNQLYIGDYFGQATSNAAPHYQCDVRFVKGTALYTGATLTVPTTPLTAVANTSYLLNYTNASILDNAMMNDLETVGNAQISTSVKKYGTGSMYFDGTDDRLVAPASPNTAFGTGDFTVEAWIYPNVLTGERGFIQTSDTAGGLKTSYTTGIVMLINVSPYQLTANVGGTNVTSSVNISATTWTHVALTRSSGSVRLFVNGALVGGPTTITTNLTGQYLCIGGYYSTTYLWNGYLDDLRITNGYARYTAAFTPPTSQLQDQ